MVPFLSAKGMDRSRVHYKTMYSEYVYHVCLKDRKGTMWNNDRA